MTDSPETDSIAVILVDHGSRRAESNLMLLDVVAAFRECAGYSIVEPAHMELAEPSIDDAFESCVRQGARRVIVFPYFLLPGRHWAQDIPRLTAAAANRHEGVEFLVTSPLGVHPLMSRMIQSRIDQCLDHAAGGEPCEICDGTDHCQLRS